MMIHLCIFFYKLLLDFFQFYLFEHSGIFLKITYKTQIPYKNFNLVTLEKYFVVNVFTLTHWNYISKTKSLVISYW